jgi:hypothetical protein
MLPEYADFPGGIEGGLKEGVIEWVGTQRLGISVEMFPVLSEAPDWEKKS